MTTAEYKALARKKRSKYGNVKTANADSRKEDGRGVELELMQKAGLISGLERQVKFELTPTIREPDVIGPRGGRKPGKVIENESYYVADYVYTDNRTGEKIVEDVKGYKGGEAYKLFKLKRKIMLYYKGIRIHEV